MFWALVVTANQAAFSQYVCQPNGAPIVTMGSISGGDPLQTTRINRDGTPSSCTGGAPVAAPVAGSYNFDQYPFTNTTGAEACVVVDYNMTACGGTTAAFSTQVNAYSTFNPATPNVNVIGEPGFSTVGVATLMFKVAAGASFVIVVHNTAAGGTCASYTLTLRYHTGCRQAGYDRSNDGKADPTYFTPSTGIWSILNSAGGTNALTFGLNGDTITPGDYTGDGQTDVSTYRPSTNTWFYATSQTSPQTNVTYIPFGASGDVPVPADYDRDGKTDVAVWRNSDGFWYILRSSDSTIRYQKWGISGDTPITGDYDGDLITDFAVVRNDGANRKWFLLNSNFGYGFVYGCGTATPSCGAGVIWGTITDRLVTGDFDGDARSDIAVYRPSDGTWQYLRSSLGAANATLNVMQAGFAWGIPGDIPQPADYDGDKFTDFAVFRPATGVWYISNSNNGTYNTFSAPTWGTATDQPATSPYRISNP
jgi:hypothetical protein